MRLSRGKQLLRRCYRDAVNQLPRNKHTRQEARKEGQHSGIVRGCNAREIEDFDGHPNNAQIIAQIWIDHYPNV